MSSTFHVSLYVESIPDAVEQYRKLLGLEPAKVKHDYAKFEISDPPVILSLNVGGEPGKLSHLGIRFAGTDQVASEMDRVKRTEIPVFQQKEATCCYAKADKFWVRDLDGVPWELYALIEDAETETPADPGLRSFLGQESSGALEVTQETGCCAPQRAT